MTGDILYRAGISPSMITRGVGMRTFKVLVQRVRDEFFPQPDEFDKAHGVKTNGRMWKWRFLDVSIAARKTAVSYQPANPEIFAQALSFLPSDVTQHLFVDLGCGKGRALLLAHKHGFIRVEGVEFSNELANRARCNVARFHDITVLHQDAGTCEFPEGQAVTIFMYNPFGPEVLSRVLENIQRRRAFGFVIYVNPQHEQILADQGMGLVHRGVGFAVWKIPRVEVASD